MKYTGILFDFNGTLIEDEECQVRAWDRIAYENFGIHVTAKDMAEKYSGKPNVLTIMTMSEGTYTPEQAEQLSQHKEEVYREEVLNMEGGAHLRKGAVEFFEVLKKNNIPFTIVSSSIKENMDFFVRTFHLDTWIDPKNLVYDNGTYKDKVQMYLDAADKLALKQPYLIIEDSFSGLKNALKTGADVIAIRIPALDDKYPQYPGIKDVIEDFTDIASYLQLK